MPEAWELLFQKRPDLFGITETDETFEFDNPKYRNYEKWKPEVISAERVIELKKLPEPDVYIVDVRDLQRTSARILSALEMSVFDIYKNFKMDYSSWIEKFMRPKPELEDEIITLSFNGEDSEIAAMLLKRAGYKYVYNCRAGSHAVLGDSKSLVDNEQLSEEAAREYMETVSKRQRKTDEEHMEDLKRQIFGNVHPTAISEVWPKEISAKEISSWSVKP